MSIGYLQVSFLAAAPREPMTYGLTGEIWLIISSSSSVCPPHLLQHPEARPQAPECGLHFQASCFTPLAPGFQPHASNHPLGFSISSIHPSPLPPHPEPRPQAPEFGLHIQPSCFTPLAQAFSPIPQIMSLQDSWTLYGASSQSMVSISRLQFHVYVSRIQPSLVNPPARGF